MGDPSFQQLLSRLGQAQQELRAILDKAAPRPRTFGAQEQRLLVRQSQQMIELLSAVTDPHGSGGGGGGDGGGPSGGHGGGPSAGIGAAGGASYSQNYGAEPDLLSPAPTSGAPTFGDSPAPHSRQPVPTPHSPTSPTLIDFS